MELDRAHVRKWKDLADAFLKQYKYNLDTAPDGMGPLPLVIALREVEVARAGTEKIELPCSLSSYNRSGKILVLTTMSLFGLLC
jgi:hypothetical protein